jgi:hypothetical protein
MSQRLTLKTRLENILELNCVTPRELAQVWVSSLLAVGGVNNLFRVSRKCNNRSRIAISAIVIEECQSCYAYCLA